MAASQGSDSRAHQVHWADVALRISSTLRRPRHLSGPATAPRAGGRERRADMQAHNSTCTESRTRAGPPSTQRCGRVAGPTHVSWAGGGRTRGRTTARGTPSCARAAGASVRGGAPSGGASVQDTRERLGVPAGLPACTGRRAGQGALGRLGAVDGREQAVLGRRAGLRRGVEHIKIRRVTKEHGATCSACTYRMRIGVALAEGRDVQRLRSRALRCTQDGAPSMQVLTSGSQCPAGRSGTCAGCAAMRGAQGAGQQGPRACGTALGSTLAQGQPLE